MPNRSDSTTPYIDDAHDT